MCSDDLDYPEFYNTSTPTAKRRHRCDECGSFIPIGEKHRYTVGKWDGEFQSFRSHFACQDLREFITDVICGGHGEIAIGGLRDEIDELGDYFDYCQDGAAWKAAGMSAPNPMRTVLTEIQQHYGTT